jgi:cell division protease FtsH
MVHEYGMGTATAAHRAVTDADVVSDVTRRIRDEEQQQLTFEAQRAAAQIITAYRDKLDEFAAALLEHEVLDRAQIDTIMADVPRPERRGASTGVPITVAAPQRRL